MARNRRGNRHSAMGNGEAIPGAQDRQAVIEETRAEEGNGQEAMGNGEEDAPSEPTPASAPSASSAVKSSPAPARVESVSYRGARRYRCRVPIVEEGIAYSVNQTIRLDAQRTRQMGPALLATVEDEDYTDAPAPGKPAPGTAPGKPA